MRASGSLGRYVPAIIELAVDLRSRSPLPEAALTDDDATSLFARILPWRLDKTSALGTLVPSGVWPQSCKARYGAALAQAAGGDGGSLAQVFAHCDVFWQEYPETLIGVLPKVKAHRHELAAALRFHRDQDMTYSYANIPFRELADIVRYRDLARLIGDEDEAKRWQAIFARFDKVLSDRRRLIAFMLWTR